jgi:hypothetical protein
VVGVAWNAPRNELDHSGDSGHETAAGGSDETAAGGTDETAAGGSDETAAGDSDETAAGGTDETAAGDSDETAAGGTDETAAGDSDETAAGGTDETAAGVLDLTAAIPPDAGGTLDELDSPLSFLARAFDNPLARANKVVGARDSPGVSGVLLDAPEEEDLPLMLKDLPYNKKKI